MFNLNLIPGDGLARAYQLFWLVLCTLLSAYGTGHAAKTVLRATVFTCEQDGASAATVRRDQSLFSGMVPRFGFSDARFDGCRERTPEVAESKETPQAGNSGSAPSPKRKWNHRGVEYVPVLHDVFFGLLSLLTAGLILCLLWQWKPWRRDIPL